MLYGSSKLICENMKRGFDYKEVKKIYSVNIVYFGLGQGEDYLYYGKTQFLGLNTNTILKPSKRQEEDYTIKQVHKIFPEYYIIKVNDFDKVAKNSIDEWIYFLKNEEIQDSFKAKGLKDAKAKLDFLKLGEKEKKQYIRNEESKMIETNVIYTARAEGKEEGFKDGIEQGIEQGIEKGAKLEKLVIARTSLTQGLDIKTTALITGLSIDEIKNIKI
jgi:predicted transposase YdaD